ncbi:MAG: hypothetical protein P8P30_10795 [Rickettsiales bacterium]|nr:hypothetical protein [Rickettsiales bacterium]
MDTEIIVRKKHNDLLTMSFMRSTAKPNTLKAKPTSLLEMTREEFKDRLNQLKTSHSGKATL